MGASDLLRITGMNSGMDTEAIISAYTSKYQKRIKKAKDEVQLNTWTQDVWKSLNSKIYSFYSSTLSANRLSGAYAKKKVTTSNSALSVVAGNNSVNGVMTAQIKSTAKAAYLTSGKLDAVASGSDNLNEALGIEEGKQISFETKDGTKKIQIGGSSDDSSVKVVKSMNELANVLKEQGVNANYDASNKRLFVGAKESGKSNDFNFGGDVETLAKLGLAVGSQLEEAGLESTYTNGATKIDATNAKLVLNGAEFESDTNTFNINGATYTINSMPANADEEISITTATDYDGVYDVVKNMLKEYNDLVNEMSKLYNAESSKGYDPLTQEQKAEMTDDEVTDWENKIKDSLLRKDETVYDILNTLTDAMSKGFEVGGKTMYLADFGISTLGYFAAEENERYALHIDGDSSDSATAGNEDKLKSMIASDPEKVTKFFTQLSQNLYTNLYSKMGSTSMSSIYKVYNDKQLESDKKDWESKISELETAMSDAEDRYYKKFSAMETALAKINSKQSALSGLFGG